METYRHPDTLGAIVYTATGCLLEGGMTADEGSVLGQEGGEESLVGLHLEVLELL